MNDTIKKICKEYIPYIVVIILVLLFKHYFFAPVKVNGASMNNTLKDKDILLLNIIDYKLNNNIKRYDIVVIDIEDEYLIKRVIGLPGDIVRCVDSEIYVNDKKIKDDFSIGKTSDFEVKVRDGEYFVLGDNREISLDSRYFGTFKREQIKGKTTHILYPFNKFGKITNDSQDWRSLIKMSKEVSSAIIKRSYDKQFTSKRNIIENNSVEFKMGL